jgi:hypothetical protein
MIPVISAIFPRTSLIAPLVDTTRTDHVAARFDTLGAFDASALACSLFRCFA